MPSESASPAPPAAVWSVDNAAERHARNPYAWFTGDWLEGLNLADPSSHARHRATRLQGSSAMTQDQVPTSAAVTPDSDSVADFVPQGWSGFGHFHLYTEDDPKGEKGCLVCSPPKIPAWMKHHDKPWEYMAPRSAFPKS